ncbi:MAG: peptidoglycan editing factor PgeF [Candidatus Acidiferrales bacterium]
MEFLRSPPLRRLPWLAHGFSTRRPGDFNLSYSVGPAPGRVTRNRRLVQPALGPPGRGRWQWVTLRQRHTDIIKVISAEDAGNPRRLRRGAVERERDGALKFIGDALITDSPGLLLAVQVADCLPILLVEPERRVVAAVHAGWRGTALRIAEKTVGRMQLEFGCDPRRTRAAIGPGIHTCCYEIGREVEEAFAGQFPYVEKVIRRVKPSPSEVHWQQRLFSSLPPTGERRPRPALTAPETEKRFLDLVEANRRQLRAAGVPQRNIWASPLCTACRTDLLFSHRAEHGHTGRMMGLIGMKVNR